MLLLERGAIVPFDPEVPKGDFLRSVVRAVRAQFAGGAKAARQADSTQHLNEMASAYAASFTGNGAVDAHGTELNVPMQQLRAKVAPKRSSNASCTRLCPGASPLTSSTAT